MEMPGIFLPYAERSMYLTGSLPTDMIKHHKKLYKCYGNILLTSFAMLVLLMYMDIPFIWNDNAKLIEAFNLISTYTVLTLKVLVCKSENIQKLINEMISMDQRIKMSGDKNILKIRHMLIARGRIFQMYVFILSSCSIPVIFLPYIINYVILWDNNNMDGERPLPFFMWFPFNKNKHYLLGLAVNFYFAVTCILFYYFGHGLLIILPLYISFRLKVLCHLLTNVKEYLKKICNKEMVGDEEVMERLFRYFAQEHQSIIRTTRTLNDSVRHLMLLEFVMLSAQIALILFEIMSNEPLAARAFAVIHLITLLLQLLALYWYANEIRLDSLAVFKALYETEWYEYNKCITSTIQIMMMRAQRPLALTVGPFGEMSLQMFLTILKGAYSYITFLQQFDSEPK